MDADKKIIEPVCDPRNIIKKKTLYLQRLYKIEQMKIFL